MLPRRLAGIVTALLMLHLGFVAGDTACATHMMDTHNGASAAPHGDMAAQMAGHGAQAAGQHQRPCEIPAQANCCQALASCGSAFIASLSSPSAPSLERDVFPPGAIDVPFSELVAPDTPPPKA